MLALGIVAWIPRRRPDAETATADEPDAPAPLVRGVVRHRDGPAAGAVLTVVSTDGRQLGAGRAGDDGAYALARTGPGRPHLLVVRWSGTSQAEPLAGVDGLVRDVALADRVPVRAPG